MKIAFIASECEPFVKTGGLADVVSSLPKALMQMGHEVEIILPFYEEIERKGFETELFFESMGVWMGAGIQEWCAVRKLKGKSEVPVFFIEFDKYFKRSGLYCDNNNQDYNDNCERFTFFSSAALQFLKDSSFNADLVHVHDWQSAPVCAYLKTWNWSGTPLEKSVSVLTIHNMGYQGIYPAENYNYTGLGWENFTSEIFEDHSRINLLKGGIYFADMVTTVSPTYASEVLNSELSYGMGQFLYKKGSKFKGILNGVDYGQWDPSVDKIIPVNYSPENIKGKKKCRTELKKRLSLDDSSNIPVIGIVSRFAHQKGLDVLTQTIEAVLSSMVVQFAVLGSGDTELEKYFLELQARMPGRIGTFIGYNNELAHLIEAGSDFFIMPSRYEPCGLNQIYSLRYGTLPIVRNTGGLSDTVIQYDEKTGEGTGFKFDYLSPNAIHDTIGWAVSTYFDRPGHMKKMMKTAMLQNFGWESSAHDYVLMYQDIILK